MADLWVFEGVRPSLLSPKRRPRNGCREKACHEYATTKAYQNTGDKAVDKVEFDLEADTTIRVDICRKRPLAIFLTE